MPTCLQGSEMRDALLGHLFGLAAVVRAGRVAEEAPALRMAALLLKLAGKKVFLREVAASVLLQLAGGRPAQCFAQVACKSCITIWQDGTHLC